MFYKFFKHSVKNLTRNVRFDANFVIKLISSLSIVYVYLVISYLGFNFEKLIHIYSSKLDPVDSINSIFIYLFLIGMLLLYFFQKVRFSDIIPYLHLPLKRGKIILYILVLTLFNFFNLGFILFVVPFSVINVLPNYGMQSFIFYFIGVLLILIFISYFVLLLRNLIIIKSFFVLVPFGIVFLVIILKTVFNVSFETISKAVFQRLLQGDIFLLIIIFFSLVGLITANFSLLKDTIYRINSEEFGILNTSKRSKPTLYKSNLIFYALLEIKLITRNKRLRGFFFTAIGFLFLFYYTFQNKQNGMYFSFIMYIILNGIFGYIFSQYLFSWESSYFEFILSTKFNVVKYLKSKYIIYLSFGFLVFLLFLPLVIQKKIDLHLFVTALLYNSCIGYFLLFYMATFNSSRIELNSNIFFNLQGYNCVQVIAIFFILFFPLLVLLLLSVIMNATQSLLIINFLSLFSLLYQKKWFKIILKQLLNRKYINLEGYRK
ncbi:MAG: DUF5687 family protein [Bacteroidia bacterium]|nr:DUF5687 family protein [Bacteroidia bacterium]